MEREFLLTHLILFLKLEKLKQPIMCWVRLHVNKKNNINNSENNKINKFNGSPAMARR